LNRRAQANLVNDAVAQRVIMPQMPPPVPQVNLYDNAYAHFADSAMAEVHS